LFSVVILAAFCICFVVLRRLLSGHDYAFKHQCVLALRQRLTRRSTISCVFLEREYKLRVVCRFPCGGRDRWIRVEYVAL